MSGDIALPTFEEVSRFTGIVVSRVGRRRDNGTFDAVSEKVTHNTQTDHGDAVFANLVAGVGGATSITGMRLGTGTTQPSKLSGGAAIGTYLNNSSIALDDLGQGAGKPGVPTQIGSGGQGWRIAYQSTWTAGTCPSPAISEVVLTDATIANAAGNAGNTVARALIDPPDNNQPGGVNEDYQIIWYKISLG